MTVSEAERQAALERTPEQQSLIEMAAREAVLSAANIPEFEKEEMTDFVRGIIGFMYDTAIERRQKAIELTDGLPLGRTRPLLDVEAGTALDRAAKMQLLQMSGRKPFIGLLETGSTMAFPLSTDALIPIEVIRIEDYETESVTYSISDFTTTAEA